MKRVIDFGLSGVGLVVLSPVLGGVAALVAARLGRPVIFSQDRPGMQGRTFRMFKFRSMTDDRDGAGELLPDEQRLTPLGKWLRATSLDELPELWNVLKGDMSLVGPRPLLVEYLPLYNSRQARRHEVRPGLTGWAQVNGRNEISWEERLELDVWYVENRSNLLDFKIMLRTIGRVLRRSGISAEGVATMPRFLGSPNCNPGLKNPVQAEE